MDRLYQNWIRVDANPRLCNSSKGERTESVWVNYDPESCSQTASHPLTDSNLHLFERPARYNARRYAQKKH